MAAISCVLIFLFVASLTGCEPLRKKFTRTKKQTVETEEIPVLEPIEYPKQILTPQDLYKKHYNLWKAWQKELSDSIVETASRKRQLYLFNQILSNLAQMQQLLIEDKAASLKDLMTKYKRIQVGIESPVPQRAATSVKMELDSLDKKVRHDYSFEKIESSLTGLTEPAP